MATLEQRRLNYHGSIVVMISLLDGLVFMGYLVLAPDAAEPIRAWGAAHRALMMMGIWMFVTAAILPSLILTRRASKLIAGSLAIGIYMTAISVNLSAMSGLRGLLGTGPLFNWIIASINGLGGPLMLLGAWLTFMGAKNALKALPSSSLQK
jgi:hypothetical protein